MHAWLFMLMRLNLIIYMLANNFSLGANGYKHNQRTMDSRRRQVYIDICVCVWGTARKFLFSLFFVSF